jgi:hypothetical protein
MTRKFRRGWIAVLVALIAIGAASAAYAAGMDDDDGNRRAALRFDVAEDPTRFVFSEEHTHADGSPAYGNYFVTQGYLYPEGTLNGSDGVLPNGRPEFPDKVLGEWTCWGTHVGDGAKTQTGPIVVTTQMFQLGKEFGQTTIVSEGYELSDVGVPVRRAITGGTGRYKSAAGEQVQRLLGFGATNGVKLRVALRLGRG